MKYAILVVFLILFSKAACAQTEKGNFLIGGSASLQASKNDDIDTKSYSLSPNISYFFFDRFAFGIITPLSASNTSQPSFSGSSKSYAIGPTIRYYFPISEQWAIFPQFDYNHQWSSTTIQFSNTGPGEIKTNTNVLRLNLGITYFIARNVGLEGILFYQNSNGDSSTTTATGPTFGIRFGLQIYLLRTKQESSK